MTKLFERGWLQVQIKQFSVSEAQTHVCGKPLRLRWIFRDAQRCDGGDDAAGIDLSFRH